MSVATAEKNLICNKLVGVTGDNDQITEICDLVDEIVGESDGTKYALAVIGGYHGAISKKLAECYIKLNDKYHPPLRPLVKLKISIEELKRDIVHCDSGFLESIGLSELILNEMARN